MNINYNLVPSATRSLLRYPGSKARLARFVAQTILANGFHCPTFVEPFCGGASVSIALLESNVVGEIVINDIDPLVAALWKCVFSKNNSRWLADNIMQVPLTLDYWKYQKNLTPSNTREMALKCLYLNRTSFSGVLHSSAGPIGGQTQAKWTIGCRFNKGKLAARILELSKYTHRVKAITNTSWLAVCKRWSQENDALFYLDPPFYHKAKRLYRFVFDDKGHKALHDYLMNQKKCSWILSYDNAGEIRALYDESNLNARIIDNTYSAHPIGGNSFIGREVVYSNLKLLPLPLTECSNHIGLSVKTIDIINFPIETTMRIPMFIR